jgi:hypothetical protein
MLGDLNELWEKVRAVELALTLSGKGSRKHCPYCGSFDIKPSADQGDHILIIHCCSECESEQILATSEYWDSCNPIEFHTSWTIPNSYREHK